MSFKELVEEVIARGFENVANEEGGEARIKRWLNQAYREIIDFRAWAFLEEEDEGKAPLTIVDLKHVLTVVNRSSGERLNYTTRAGLEHWDPGLVAAGTATQWFLDGEDELHVYPVDADSTIQVRYIKKPADLKEDKDEPIFDADYHDLIVDAAVVRAYKNIDNFEAAGFLRQEFDRGMRNMVRNLRKSYDGNRMIQRSGTVDDYLC